MGTECDLVFEGGGAKGYGATEFDISAKRLEALIAAGRAAMTNNLDFGGF